MKAKLVIITARKRSRAPIKLGMMHEKESGGRKRCAPGPRRRSLPAAVRSQGAGTGPCCPGETSWPLLARQREALLEFHVFALPRGTGEAPGTAAPCGRAGRNRGA